MLIKKSPSGALSPYYYKGGYFHGIHYGSYFDNADALFSIMEAEEKYILSSPEKRRLMVDLYETGISEEVLSFFTKHIEKLSEKIIKLGVSADKKALKILKKALYRAMPLGMAQMYFSPDMEEVKTWLVSDSY